MEEEDNLSEEELLHGLEPALKAGPQVPMPLSITLCSARGRVLTYHTLAPDRRLFDSEELNRRVVEMANELDELALRILDSEEG